MAVRDRVLFRSSSITTEDFFMPNHNCSIAIQMLPETDTHTEMIAVIDEVIAHIKSVAQTHAYNVCVSPFETVIEGDFDELMKFIKSCHEIAIQAGTTSIMSYIKIAYHANGVMTIDEKISKHQ